MLQLKPSNVKLQISDDLISDFFSKVDRHGPPPAHLPHLGSCWIWTAGISNWGYGRFYYRVERGRWLNLRAHRVSWVIHFGQVPDDFLVLHRCDVRRCVNPEHLFVGSYADNNQDTAHKRRRPAAEEHPMAKLNWEKVESIRKMFSGCDGRLLGINVAAEQFGVSRAAIHALLNNKTWSR